MSRRSLITPEENLIRSQRRGVPNVRMWSEQETPPRVAWDGYEEEPLPQLVKVGGIITSLHKGVDSVSMEGANTAVALMMTAGVTGVAAPAGWREIDRGVTVGGFFTISDGEWVLAAKDDVADPSSSFRFTYQAVGGAQLDPQVCMYVARGFGFAGGTWKHVVDSRMSYPAHLSAASIPPGVVAWLQVIAMRNSSLNWSGPIGWPGQDAVVVSSHPWGSIPETWWETGGPVEGEFTWGGAGIWGTRAGLTMALGYGG